jgi:hypothetical protein
MASLTYSLTRVSGTVFPLLSDLLRLCGSFLEELGAWNDQIDVEGTSLRTDVYAVSAVTAKHDETERITYFPRSLKN